MRPSGAEPELSDMVQAALKQIEEQNVGKGIPKERIRKYGFLWKKGVD